jgi:hypothetical protein
VDLELPVVFRISLNSFYGRSFTLIMREGKLIYNSTRPTTMVVRTPTNDDWEKFWKKTVKLKIWLWHNEYVDKSSSDGSSWSVNVEKDKLRLKSYGSGCFPDNFSEFTKIVRELIPGLEFSCS